MRSSFRTRSSSFLVFIVCKISVEIPTGSRIVLFFKNPNCLIEITLDSIGFNMLEMIFEISLYIRLQSEICQKSTKNLVFSQFGTTVRKVELSDFSIFPSFRDFSTAFNKSSHTSSKKSKKNSIGQPSRLELLYLCIECIASLSSSSLTSSNI